MSATLPARERLSQSVSLGPHYSLIDCFRLSELRISVPKVGNGEAVLGRVLEAGIDLKSTARAAQHERVGGPRARVAGRRAACLAPDGIRSCLDLAEADGRLIQQMLTKTG